MNHDVCEPGTLNRLRAYERALKEALKESTSGEYVSRSLRAQAVLEDVLARFSDGS